MNKFALMVIVTLTAWLQAYFFSALSGWHSVLNLLLPLLLAIVLTRSLMLSVTAALWGGFWLDVATPGPLGAHMLFYTTFVLVVVLLRRTGLEFNNRLLVGALLGIGVLVYHNWLAVLSWLATSSSLWQPGLWSYWLLDVLLVWFLAATLGRRFSRRLKAMGSWQ